MWKQRGTHGPAVHSISRRGRSGRLASVGRAHASRECLLSYYNAQCCPDCTGDGSRRLSLSCSSRALRSPSSPSRFLPLLCLLPAPSRLLRGPVNPQARLPPQAAVAGALPGSGGRGTPPGPRPQPPPPVPDQRVWRVWERTMGAPLQGARPRGLSVRGCVLRSSE